MTTRFEDAMEDLRERSQGPCLLETQKYLRDLHASHEALLRCLIEADDVLAGEGMNSPNGTAQSIAIAEELRK